MLTANPITNLASFNVTEEHTVFELDHRLEKAGVFRVHKEVSGCYLQPRAFTERKSGTSEDKGARIDRLLMPTPALLDAGWKYGAVGIECKKPGKKLGPALAQCMDYTRAVFKMPGSSVMVMCNWIMLWPMEASDIAGDIGSIMDQNRIGGVTFSKYYTLQFKTSSCNLLTVDKDGTINVGKALQGGKVGSR